MRTIEVIVFDPVIGCCLDFGQRVEEIGIQNLLPVAFVKALDERVLIGLSRLDEPERDVLSFCPLDKGLCGHFGSIIETYCSRFAIDLDQFIHDPLKPDGRYGRANFYPQGLPIAFIYNIEGSEGTAVVKRVPHEVQRPGQIKAFTMIKGLSGPLRDTLSGPSLHIELQIAVNAMNPLVIKPMTIKPDTVKTLPKAPARLSVDDLLKCINNRLIPLQSVLLWPIKRRPRQAYNPAGPGLWQVMVNG